MRISMKGLLMLMQMRPDIHSCMSQAMALDSQSETAWAAWDSAAVARRQAQRACMKDGANPDLLQKLEEAKEDEGEKKERYEQIQKQLEVNDTEMQALLVYLAAPSEPSAPLLCIRCSRHLSLSMLSMIR